MTSLPILGTIREERGKDVYLRVTCGVGLRGVDSIEARYCTTDQLSWRSDYEQDLFAARLARKLQRRHFWTSFKKSIWEKIFPASKHQTQK